MLRIHNATLEAVNFYNNKRLVIANLTQNSTSVYVEVSNGCLVGKTMTGNVVVKMKIRVKCDKKYTAIYGHNLNGTSSQNTEFFKIYKDKWCHIKNGAALVRILDATTDNSNNIFNTSSLGMQTFSYNNSSLIVDVINQGVYTLFYSNNSMVSVLYNTPDKYEVDLNFERYIGSWVVVSSLPSTSTVNSYMFYENSEGKFELDNTVSVRFTWIVHDTDYKTYSLNGSPNRQRLVILTRCGMSCERYKELVCLAKKLGYDVSKLVVSDKTSFSEKERM